MKSVLSIIISGLLISGCERHRDALDEVRGLGELRVLVRGSPTTYYEGVDGPTGLEYDLVSRFAEDIGVELKVIPATTPTSIVGAISRGAAHLAAAGLRVTPERSAAVRFGPAYQEITQQLIYRQGKRRPRTLDDIEADRLEVAHGSGHVASLKQLKRQYPYLEWAENSHAGSDGLLERVWRRELDYTVADSNEVTLLRRFYPELRIAFDLGSSEPLAWAFPPGRDNSLYDAAYDFFARLRESGELEQLVERHYGHVSDFDYVATRRLITHVNERLPDYEQHFRSAAAVHDLDWRLLAAIGYQESQWDPSAVSPTGVRGIMMLTHVTAKQMGIDNRLDPASSIEGGGKYYARLKRKISPDVPEPDRTWFALAAYNIGYGHLADVRRLVRDAGADPNKWVVVKKYLPLLREKQWHQRTRHGFARGDEGVLYVSRVRRYFDMLVGLEDKGHLLKPRLANFDDEMTTAPSL